MSVQVSLSILHSGDTAFIDFTNLKHIALRPTHDFAYPSSLYRQDYYYCSYDVIDRHFTVDTTCANEHWNDRRGSTFTNLCQNLCDYNVNECSIWSYDTVKKQIYMASNVYNAAYYYSTNHITELYLIRSKYIIVGVSLICFTLIIACCFRNLFCFLVAVLGVGIIAGAVVLFEKNGSVFTTDAKVLLFICLASIAMMFYTVYTCFVKENIQKVEVVKYAQLPTHP
jgi:hypothetical protein